MMNAFQFIGRLTADPDITYSGSGTAIAKFMIAVNRTYAKRDDQTADFIRITAFGKTAESVANYQKKGSLVGVEGKVQTGSYVDRDSGKTRYTTDFIARDVHFLGPKNVQRGNAGGNKQTGGGYSGGRSGSNDIESSDPFAGVGEPIDIADDSLPF